MLSDFQVHQQNMVQYILLIIKYLMEGKYGTHNLDK